MPSFIHAVTQCAITRSAHRGGSRRRRGETPPSGFHDRLQPNVHIALVASTMRAALVVPLTGSQLR
jgi:hypothetical protein